MGERIERQPLQHHIEFKSAEDERHHRSLEPLACGIAIGDPAAKEIATLVLRPIVDPLGRLLCRRMSHRNSPCRGATDPADHAYDAICDLIHDQLLGSPGGPRAKLLDWLADPSRCTLAQFVAGRAQPRDAAEAWRRHREIVQRPRGRAIERLVDEVGRAFGAGEAPEPVVRAAATIGFEPRLDTRNWFNALFEDACEPAPEQIDADRMRRYLAIEVSGLSLEQVGDLVRVLAAFIDRCLSTVAPDAYDTYLTRPRSMTRPPQRAPWEAELEAAADRDAEGEDQVRAHRLAALLAVENHRTGRPFRLLLTDAAVTAVCGFDPDELAQLRALDEAAIRRLVVDILADDDPGEQAA